jgi:hypothetical protein
METRGIKILLWAALATLRSTLTLLGIQPGAASRNLVSNRNHVYGSRHAQGKTAGAVAQFNLIVKLHDFSRAANAPQ